MTRLYLAASPNGPFDWPSEPHEDMWRCFHLGSCESLDREMYDSEYIADQLDDWLLEERLDELRNASPFNDDEWRRAKENHDLAESENSNSAVEFPSKDTLGRFMNFVSEFGNWGTYMGSTTVTEIATIFSPN